MNDDKQRGIYHKFAVIRIDGGTLPGRKHEHCEHFVLDLTHDKHAPAAMRAYADSCVNEFPRLADDIDKMFPRPAKQPAPQSVTPTVPGWYWVNNRNGFGRFISYLTKESIKTNWFRYCDTNFRFEDCQFAPIPLPEGWEK